MPSSDDSVTAVELVDPLIGTIFDKRFRVDERLAAGGFGAIYRATHVKSGHQIALKVLHPKLASDLGVLARFRREGTTLTSLRNPHTITAYEFGQADKILFIVLELLHGETLFDRYSVSGPMEWKRVVHVAKQVCESLEEAHAQGIVHRDLKPTNIHLEHHDNDPDYVKVLDFGIAKILRGSEHDSSDITNAGQMIGTLDYMSPEQMVGGQVTGQTDIYTLGIVMYEMIAGTRPFPESQTATAALAAMLKTTPEPLYLRAPIPRELDAIVMRCLERETQKRYRNVGELRADLERVVSDAISPTTATVMLPKRTFDDNDETAITPPPDSLLREAARPPGNALANDDTLRTPKVDLKKVDPKTPRAERHTPGLEAKTPRMERAKSANLREWGDDDEVAPTTTRRPDGMDDGVPAAPAPRVGSAGAPRSKRSEPSIPPLAIPQTPMPRPLEARHQPTPVPQLVVAPFSQPRPKPPTQPPPIAPLDPRTPDPRSRNPTGHPPFGAQPQLVQDPASGRQGTSIGVPPPPQAPVLPPLVIPPMQGAPIPYGQTAPGPYDMSKLAARDAAMRRLIWIVVSVIAVIVGIVIATRL